MCDTDLKRLQTAGKFWKVEGLAQNTSKLMALDPEVLSIAVPTTLQLKTLRELPLNTLKALFLEKPVGRNLEEFHEIEQILRSNNVPTQVNYLRRFSSQFQLLRDQIGRGDFGRASSIIVNYENGILNNGSHAIDLLHFLIGPTTSVDNVTKVRDSRDQSDDPTLSFTLELNFKNHPVRAIFNGHDHRLYSLFEIDLFFENARVSVSEFGETLQYFQAGADAIYPEYRSLKLVREQRNCLSGVFENAVEELFKLATSESPKSICSVADCKRLHLVVAAAFQALHSKRKISIEETN